MIRRLVPAWVAQRFATRKCRGAEPGHTCPEPSSDGFHTAHLTAFGRWLYTHPERTTP
jgi:hypothetical protein